MTQTKFISKAPANSMLLGEHSVVYGYPALACGLDQWIQVEWTRISEPEIRIDSALANHRTSINTITEHPQLKFVCHALQQFKNALAQSQYGWQLKIHSEFSSTIGLGSSAAVLAATLVGLNHLTESNFSPQKLWQIGKQIIIDIQGRGSATDLAASLFGGVVYFQPPFEDKPLQIESVPLELQLLLIYSGYKTPTGEVLAMVANNWQDQPQQLTALYQEMGQITETAYQAVKMQNWSQFYQCFTDYQALMVKLGVSDETLDSLLAKLDSCQQVQASKISGSGLGDCVLAIGSVDSESASDDLLLNCPAKNQLCNYLQLQLPLSSRGAHIV